MCVGDPGVTGNAACRALPPPEVVQQLQQRNRHKMALIVPYRDRPKMLETFLPAVSNFLKARPDCVAQLGLGFR